MKDIIDRLLELESYLTYCSKNWRQSEIWDPMGHMTERDHQLVCLLESIRHAQQKVIDIVDSIEEQTA